jgi:hypothetical protein
MFPEVNTRLDETHVFWPIDKRFEGVEFPIPTLDKVMKAVPEFVNWRVFEVVFPLSETAWRVVAIVEVDIEVNRPFESIVMLGI